MGNTADNIDMKWVELLWDEFKYRHELYWKSLYLWGGAAITVFIAPFFKPELKSLGFSIFIFPIIGLVLSLVGAWHLGAEGERLAQVSNKYNQIRDPKYTPERMFEGKPRNWWQQAIKEPIVKAVSLLFLFGFVLLTIIDILLLFILLHPENWIYPFSVSMFILIVAIGLIWIFINERRLEYNKSLNHKNDPELEKYDQS